GGGELGGCGAGFPAAAGAGMLRRSARPLPAGRRRTLRRGGARESTPGPRPEPVTDPAVAALPADLQRLLRVVAMAANEARTVRSALQSCLDTVCTYAGWPLAHAFLRQQDGDDFFPAEVWYVSPPGAFPAFREGTAGTSLRLGQGIIGRVAESAAPVVVDHVESGDDFARAGAGDELRGFGAAFVPLMAGEPAGVLEFYFPIELTPQPELLQVLTMIGRQVGRVVERERAEEALRISEA